MDDRYREGWDHDRYDTGPEPARAPRNPDGKCEHCGAQAPQSDLLCRPCYRRRLGLPTGPRFRAGRRR